MAAKKPPKPDQRPGVVGAPYVDAEPPEAPEYEGTVYGAPTVDGVPAVEPEEPDEQTEG